MLPDIAVEDRVHVTKTGRVELLRSVDPTLAISALAIGLAFIGVQRSARAADLSQSVSAPPNSSAAPAKTEEGETEGDKGAERWIVILGLKGIVSPSFPGSAQLRPYPFPAIGFRRADSTDTFSGPDDSFGFSIIDIGAFHAGPVANFESSRGQRDGLFGLHTVPLTHEVGGFAEFTPIPHIRTRAELRQGVDGHRGFVGVLSADLYGSSGPVTMSIGPRLGFCNNRYADAYFSVTPLEAAFNGRLTPYEASGGLASAGAAASLRYSLTQATNVIVFAGLQRLSGSVGSSPIPNVIGSRNQFTSGLSIERSFEFGKFW